MLQRSRKAHLTYPCEGRVDVERRSRILREESERNRRETLKVGERGSLADENGYEPQKERRRQDGKKGGEGGGK